MDTQTKEELQRLLNLDPGQFTEEDKAFLLARRDYLTSEQKRIFSPVLGERASEPSALPPVQHVIEQVPAEVPAPTQPVQSPEAQVQPDSGAASTGVDPYDPDAQPAQ